MLQTPSAPVFRRVAGAAAFIMLATWLSVACGSDGGDTDATATAGAAATATARFADATQAPLAPADESAVRDDCPSGSVTFRHPSGVASPCAPSDMTAFSAVIQGAPTMFLSSDQAFAVPTLPRLAVSVALTDQGFGEDAPIAELCQSQGLTEVRTTVAGYAARGCAGQDQGSDVRQLTIALPDGASEFAFAQLQTFARIDSPGSSELADQIIQSVRIEG